MKTHLLKLVLALHLFFLLAQAGFNPKCDINDQSSNLKVYHIYSPCSPFRPAKPISWGESVLQMLAKDQARLQYLSSLVGGKKSSEPIAWGRNLIQSPTYILRVKIGTPAQTFLMALDTSNDAAWVPCTGCIGCSSTLFNSAKSTTFRSLGCQTPQCKQVPNPTCGGRTCTFNVTYGGSTIAANLSQDNITLATDPIPNFTFGCIQKATGTSVPPQGLLGLGRGPLSLLSLTQNLYKSKFSYCLPSFKSPNFSGSLRLGPVGQPITIKYTPLLTNPRRPSLYYVNMVGIRVGRRVLNIPASAFAFNPTTGAGTIVDSGTVYTRLVQPAYIAVRDEFRRRIRNATVTTLGGFDTCYSVPIVAPTITFMFAGNVNMTLPVDNILLRGSQGSISCLAMAAAPDNVNSVVNVIASMQQQNHRIVYDVANSRLGIARELCS
ncbi:Asparticase nepenthesin-1 [Tripterygium wilfordii]|uniref:Asparticase nepenthesin-1 n=1 Tax=Tripterygium wilfordii TaxID=458696 RepID=A0A7J7C6E1_TRIWF|nr:aspartyl protease AED3-like [Tripterygium wilfordii]KAF5729326.1 Asparticase nepenthesin-1 [Tripterygium wilfordii]